MGILDLNWLVVLILRVRSRAEVLEVEEEISNSTEAEFIAASASVQEGTGNDLKMQNLGQAAFSTGAAYNRV